MNAGALPNDAMGGNDAFDAAAFASLTGATEAQLSDLCRFEAMLQQWSGRMNLVGPSAMAEFWRRHAWDSAQLLRLVEQAATFADLGAGAGFPGVVLAIMRKGTANAQVHLVESMAKRCLFLHAVVNEIGLPARVHNARAESLTLTVDIVTARACAPMHRLLGYAEPFLARGATGLFLKGQDVEAEIEEAAQMWTFRAELIPSLSGSGQIVRVEGKPVARH